MKEFRISEFLSPGNIIKWRYLLWKSQYFPPEKLQLLQWNYLSKILDFCFEHVPYYKRLFQDLGLKRDDIRSMKDITLLPILSKDTVLEKHDEFIPDNLEKCRPITVRTSGTTGSPLELYWDVDVNIFELVCQWRHFSWLGYNLADPFMDIRSFSRHLGQKYRWNWKCRGLEFSSQYINEANINEYADLLRKYKIKFWRGHSSAMNYLCQLLDYADIQDVKPKFIVSVGETLLENQRDYIENWTGALVRDNYGLNEHTALICQCPDRGYHICSEYGLVEIINDNGKPAQPGEEGRIISTGLHNKAFPLLRYDTRDYAVYSDKKCQCGRTLPLIESLTGRADDRLVNANGKVIAGLHNTFKYANGIKLSQIVQKEAGVIDVYVVPINHFDDPLKELLIRVLKNELGNTMVIRIHVVDDIPYRKPGKFKFVVSLLKDKQIV
ncbi:phenylacetate--CoA ligase family protein [candidate division KSB1 bacterium]|nr:phenylacetate--CoA ligase family protein [candidate division KSB1 bacterium]